MNYKDLSSDDQKKLGEVLTQTLDYIYNSGDKNNLSYDNGNFTTLENYTQLRKLDKGIAELVAIAASDKQVVTEVKNKISDAILKNNKKVIFVAHSQGNEALRTSYQELKNELSSDELKTKMLKKEFGSLHVASPSPILLTEVKSRAIKLDTDLVISASTLFTSKNTPIDPNYFFDSENSNKTGWRSIPIIGDILGTIVSFATTNLFHAFDDVYVNEKLYARSVASDASTSDNMANIFFKNLTEVAETLEDNCLIRPTVTASVIYPGSKRQVSFNVNFPTSVNFQQLVFNWNFGDNLTERSSAYVTHTYEVYGEYNYTVEVKNIVTNESVTLSNTVIVEPEKTISVITGTTTYKKLLLVSSGEYSGFGILHKRAANFDVAGPVGTLFSTGPLGDDINVLDCGDWTAVETPGYKGCQRGVDDPITTVIYGKNVTQCGGIGCESVSLYGYGIPYTETEIPIYYFTGTLPKPFDF